MSNKFKFSKEELNKFREQGFAGPFDLYDQDEIRTFYSELRSQVFDRTNAAYELDHTSLLAGYDRHLDIEFFSKHIKQNEIVDRVSSILGPDLICWRSEMFPKYPGDEGTDWHQADNFGHASEAPQVVWPQNASFGGAITVWTAVTDCDIENGCLRVIPGTHEEMFYDESKDMTFNPEIVNKLDKNGEKLGFFGYDYRNLQKDPSWVPDESKAVPLKMKAGQFVIFWSTLMHASFPNTSKDRLRLGFTARYVPTSVKIYPNLTEIEEYGSTIKLDKYGTVLVRGKDEFEYNKLLEKNLAGITF